MRVHEATTETKAPGAPPSYKARKPQIRARTRENTPPRHNLWVNLKELIAIPDVVRTLNPPPKTDKRLGPSKTTWCEFHQAIGHNLRSCLVLGFQLDELVRGGFLKHYLQEQGGLTTAAPTRDQGHKVPIHGEINTIAGGFSGGGCTASQRKKYARGVMKIEVQGSDLTPKPDLVFTKIDLQDVVPHDNDPVVISVVIAGRKVHHVLVDQGSSTDVMFWSTFNKLQLSPDQLRPYVGCLYGFARDQVEVRGHIELRTTLTNGVASRTVNIRYLVVNAPSAYNILLSIPVWNMIGAVVSSRHMKMKLPSIEGVVITLKFDQKEANRCYENNLKTKRGVCSVTTQPPKEEGVTRLEVAQEQRPEPT